MTEFKEGKALGATVTGGCINRGKVFRDAFLCHQTDGNRCKSFYFFKSNFQADFLHIEVHIDYFFLI